MLPGGVRGRGSDSMAATRDRDAPRSVRAGNDVVDEGLASTLHNCMVCGAVPKSGDILGLVSHPSHKLLGVAYGF